MEGAAVVLSGNWLNDVHVGTSVALDKEKVVRPEGGEAGLGHVARDPEREYVIHHGSILILWHIFRLHGAGHR